MFMVGRFDILRNIAMSPNAPRQFSGVNERPQLFYINNPSLTGVSLCYALYRKQRFKLTWLLANGCDSCRCVSRLRTCDCRMDAVKARDHQSRDKAHFHDRT